MQLLDRTRSFRPGMEVVSVCPPGPSGVPHLTLPQKPVFLQLSPRFALWTFGPMGRGPGCTRSSQGAPGSWAWLFSLYAQETASVEPVEPQATITCCSGTPLCQRQAGLGLAFRPSGEGLLGGILYTPLPPHCTHRVPSVTGRGGDGHSWGVHLLPGKAGAGEGGCGSRLPPPHWTLRPAVRRAAGSTILPPSALPPRRGWPHCVPEPLPGICIFEATDTDRGFNESKVASWVLTDARPRYYF